MKTIIVSIAVLILINFSASAQRDKTTGGRGTESGRIDRIKKNSNNERTKITQPKTIIDYPKVNYQRQPDYPPIKSEGIPIEGDQIKICRVTEPDMFKLLDSTQDLYLKEQIRNAYLVGDFFATIQLLTEAIKIDPFNPDLHFFRGNLYLQIWDYYHAKWNFFTVKVLDPLYPNLFYYINLTDSLLNPRGILKPVTNK
jgi:hypothetical protein